MNGRARGKVLQIAIAGKIQLRPTARGETGGVFQHPARVALRMWAMHVLTDLTADQIRHWRVHAIPSSRNSWQPTLFSVRR